MHVNQDILRRFKADLPVQWGCKKYSAFPKGQIIGIFAPIPPHQRGVCAIVRKCEAGSGGRDASGAVLRGRMMRRVRRSRVVLMPRRWHQVLKKLALLGGDGGKKARSPGRARNKP